MYSFIFTLLDRQCVDVLRKVTTQISGYVCPFPGPFLMDVKIKLNSYNVVGKMLITLDEGPGKFVNNS